MKKYEEHKGIPFLSALLLSLVLMVVCGLIYPLIVTGISQLVMPRHANGDLIMVHGQPVGSEHVGQLFTEDCYMKGRRSAVNYNTFQEGEEIGIASGSDNLGATDPALLERTAADIERITDAGIAVEDIPSDMIYQSGSGLDPHISVENAMLQVPFIAEASGISVEKLTEIVEKNTEKKVLGVLGQNKVNVLKVNLDIARELGNI